MSAQASSSKRKRTDEGASASSKKKSKDKKLAKLPAAQGDFLAEGARVPSGKAVARVTDKQGKIGAVFGEQSSYSLLHLYTDPPVYQPRSPTLSRRTTRRSRCTRTRTQRPKLAKQRRSTTRSSSPARRTLLPTSEIIG